MIKTYVIFLITISLHARSQTIVQGDLPFAGLGWIMGTDDGYANPVPAGGADQTWDYSALQNVAEDTAYFLNAAGTPYADSFPSANICTHRDGDPDWAYFTNSSSGFYINGFATDTGVFALSPAQMYVPVPFSYNDTHTDISRIQIDTAFLGLNGRIIFNFNNTFHADGYGTLVTPAATYDSTLRVRQTLLETDSIMVDLFGTGNYTLFGTPLQRQTTIYRWYRHGGTANYVMGIYADSLGTTSESSEYLRQWAVISVDEIEKNHPLSVYPNPASGLLNIYSSKSVPDMIEIFNLEGQNIFSQKPLGNSTPIATSDFNPGIYFFRLHYGDVLRTGRFVIGK